VEDILSQPGQPSVEMMPHVADWLIPLLADLGERTTLKEM
jgi:hypothetical protein